jgi:hypothetical protein
MSIKHNSALCYNGGPWLVYCLCQMILTAFILIYVRNTPLTKKKVAIDVESHSHMRQIIFLEILVSSAILIDVVITRFVLGQSAYKNFMWWIDIALFIGVILGISIYGKKMNYVEQDIDLGFILTRYAFQLLRLLLYVIK